MNKTEDPECSEHAFLLHASKGCVAFRRLQKRRVAGCIWWIYTQMVDRLRCYDSDCSTLFFFTDITARSTVRSWHSPFYIALSATLDLHCHTAPSPSYPFLISRGCFSFSHHHSSSVWYAPSSAIVNRILHQVHNFNVGVATAESWRSRSGFETVVRIETRLVTGFEIGLVVGLILQFDCSVRYYLVSSGRERKEGNSDASKKDRIM